MQVFIFFLWTECFSTRCLTLIKYSCCSFRNKTKQKIEKFKCINPRFAILNVKKKKIKDPISIFPFESANLMIDGKHKDFQIESN